MATKKNKQGPKKSRKVSGVYLEAWPLNHLLTVKAERNPKAHDIPGIIDSIREDGYVDPIVINEKTGRVVAGHGRIEALDSMRAAGEEAPGGIETDGRGEWFIPVLRGKEWKSEAAAENYLIRVNDLVMTGGYVKRQLWEILEEKRKAKGEDGIRAAGFNLERLRKMTPTDKRERLEGEIKVSPELLESHNYFIVTFDNVLDWNVAQKRMGLKTVKTPDSRSDSDGKWDHKGLGRIVSGKKFLQVIREKIR